MSKADQAVLQLKGIEAVTSTEVVQDLWSGYGQIRRSRVQGATYSSLIVKHIQPPTEGDHPKGWHSNLSHERKLKSYAVESAWYQYFSARLDGVCKVPQCYYSEEERDEMLLILEDLDESGYPERRTPNQVSLAEAKQCLTWLAAMHATFMGTKTDRLWPIGSYWHLETRPDEWRNMQNKELKDAAKAIDERLAEAEFQTLIHGDAKLANFCFGFEEQVAAVDFQYVGRGCGMKDVAYFISSCFGEEACGLHEEALLGHYFSQLKLRLHKSIDYQLVKDEWSELYKYAWADFYRFLDGWSPGHWKMHRYSHKLVSQVFQELDK